MSDMVKKELVVDMTVNPIRQIGIVVKDVVDTAKQYAEYFGIGPWYFFDNIFEDTRLHEQPVKDGKGCIRVGITNFGDMEIKLLQPVYGPSMHMEFLQTHGQGIHHLSFGEINNQQAFVSRLEKNGCPAEMSGTAIGKSPFCYMATQKALGAIYEAHPPISEAAKSRIKPWGMYTPPEGQGIINLDGKKIAQVGIIVEDVENVAQNYQDIFGIGPWTLLDFKPPLATCDHFVGTPVLEGLDFCVRAAIANHGDLEIELLQPVYGPSTHMDFLKVHGQGIHHMSLHLVDDHDEIVSAITNRGGRIEMSGTINKEMRYTYMDTRADLCTIWECAKIGE